MVYSFNTVIYGPKKVAIDLAKVRSYISAHHGESDERIEEILMQACEDTEKKLDAFYIMAQVVEMTHQRPDVWIRKGPVQSILTIHLKNDRSWREVYNSNKQQSLKGEIFDEYPQNNGTRWIKIHNWRENQQVRIRYKTGYWDDESPHKMPYSVQEYILTRCYQIYMGTQGGKDFLEMQRNIISGFHESRVGLM